MASHGRRLPCGVCHGKRPPTLWTMAESLRHARGINKLLLINREIDPARITMSIVKENLGFQC